MEGLRPLGLGDKVLVTLELAQSGSAGYTSRRKGSGESEAVT